MFSEGILTLLSGRSRGLAKLTKTQRPFFLQSLTLVYACRTIPIPSRLDDDQQRDLRKLTTKIEKALYSGTQALAQASKDFDEANDALKTYLEKYNIKLGRTISQETKPVGREEAAQQIKMIGNLVNEKWEKLKKAPLIQVPLQVWSDTPTSFHWEKRNGKDGMVIKFNTAYLEREITIEEQATLNMLLHRLLMYSVTNSTLAHSVSLVQYPQFYQVFPSTVIEFTFEAGGADGQIPSLDPSRMVKEARAPRRGTAQPVILQLVIERKPKDSMALKLWNESLVTIPDEYNNAWLLRDSDKSSAVVARMRTPSFPLLLWRPTTNEQEEPPRRQIKQSPAGTGSSPGRTPPENVLLNEGLAEVDSAKIRAKKEAPPAKVVSLESNQVQMGQTNVVEPNERSRESLASNSRRKRVAERDTPALENKSGGNLSKEALHMPALKHRGESDRTLVGEQAPPEPASSDRSIGNRSTVKLHRPLLEHADSPSPTLVDSSQSTSRPTPLDGSIGNRSIHRPLLEHADSSSPTLVGSSQSTKGQTRSLPTFDGELIHGSMTIGMTAVRKPKKKQGWFSGLKNWLGFE